MFCDLFCMQLRPEHGVNTENCYTNIKAQDIRKIVLKMPLSPNVLTLYRTSSMKQQTL